MVGSNTLKTIRSQAPKSSWRCAGIGLALLLGFAASLTAADRKLLHGHVPPGVERLQPLDRLPGAMNLHLAIGLLLRDQAGLTNFLQQLYDPASTNFRQYLTSEQFTERFGPTEQDYQAVIAFAQANGLTVTGTKPNRLLLDVTGSVGDIERAFRFVLRVYRHPSEPRNFHAPDVEPSIPPGLPVLDISGLDDYMPPRPMNLKRPPLDQNQQSISYATGSGPGGDFIGYDFRAAYAPGVTLTGVGQIIGLFEFGPYFTNDIILYKQAAGLPDVTVTNVLLDGYTGIPAPGTDDGEEALDIDMAMCMAPGATIIVYEGNSAIDILNRMATDNKAKQMGCSFGFYPPPGSMDNVFMQFAAQGQTMFVASGDGGAYSTNLIFAPADDPNITSVGGTSLTTTGPRGSWVSETTWIGSGGGFTPHYTIPSYQAGMDMSVNHGSTTRRNFPDVAMLADTVIYWVLKNGQTGTVGGTSAAAPLWAGFMALVNQQAVANGKSAIGNLNSVIYSIGNGSNNYATVFHDITTGNNVNTASPTNFFANPGFDLCTGWGSPNGSNLINMLAAPADALQITPGTGFTITTPFGVPFSPAALNFSLTNAGLAVVNWTLVNTSLWLNASATAGALLPASPATNVTLTLNTSAVSNLSAGYYYANVWITNTTSSVVQSRLFTLIVSPANFPITFSGFNASVVVPTNGTPLAPHATAFDIPNNWCFYQAGLNTNAPVVAGSGTQGLPPGGLFTSQADGTTVFQFGPYGANDALLMGNTYPVSGTLTLAVPQSYNSLAILASSANGGGSGTLVIHFSNGATSQAFSFNAQDWFNNTANVALQGFGRLQLGSNPFSTQNAGSSNPNFYQTIINLAASGLNQPVSSITFTKPAGGASQDSGVFALSGSLMPSQVIITQQPQSTTNSSGGASSFTVAAMGAPPLAYQWYNGTPASSSLLGGQTNSSLVFNPAQTNNAGSYFAVVTNSFNAVTSSVATLTVLTAPVITQQPNPTNVILFAGATNKFSVSAIGAVPLSFFWRLNGATIATGSSYTLNNVQTNNSGNYSAVVSNSFGSVTSSVVSLTVLAPPTAPYPAAVVADHPLAYYRLDEASGTIAHDFWNANNGAYTNVSLSQPGYNPLDSDRAAGFGSLSAINSYVGNIPIDFATSGNAAFSVEVWVKGNAQTSDAGIITKGTGAGGEQFNLDTGAGNHAFRFFVRDAASGTARLANGTVALNGNWHHVVGVCNETAGLVVLYVDGVSNAAGTITAGSGLLSSTNPVSLGSRQSGSGAYDAQFIGTLDEAAIYNYALSAAQIQKHYSLRTNFPPVFASNPFTKPNANVAQAYSSSIATNATDPNGDPITFSKISGPAWLSVAGNGSLSGTPANPDVGTNTFLVSARDPGGLSNNATMYILVNGAPVFINNPFTETDANAGLPYSANIATNATDPNGDTLTFDKVSGPAWLSVAGDGTLSGTPLSRDDGANSFVVRATDPGSLSGTATMNINVNPAPPILTAISFQATNILLNWAGGIAPYQVQMTTNLINPAWQNIAGPISTNTLTVSPSNNAAFYRILGQ